MNKREMSLYERLWQYLLGLYSRNKIPFLASLIFGFAAHGYAFSNKLLNHDEIESLFGKGATVTSGRWGLEAVKLLFPDRSMPWIYGMISLLLMAVSVCLIIRLLKIKSKPRQVIIAALILSFPSLTGTFCFMFTSTAYALAFLFTVLSVWVFQNGGRFRLIISSLLLVAGLGMYQAYISVAACLYMLLMIEDALDKDSSVRDIVLYGVKALALMLVGIAIYYGISQLVFAFTGAEFNDYVLENVNADIGIIRRIRMAYDSFLYVFTFRNFYLISSESSRYIHIALCCILLLSLGLIAYSNKKPVHAILLAGLIILLPLAIECMYLIMSDSSIHTLVIYGFIAVYLLCAVVSERLMGKRGRVIGDVMSLLLSLIVVANVYFANMCYLKMDLQYKNASSFYTSLIAQVKNTEGFDRGTKLAILGRQDNLLYDFPELDTDLMLGPSAELINIYSRENFFRFYLGFDVPFAGEEELQRLAEDSRVAEMCEYPYYGSVKKIDDYIVVKLG